MDEVAKNDKNDEEETTGIELSNECVDEAVRQDIYNTYEFVVTSLAVKMYKNYTKRDFTPSIDIEDVIQTAKMSLWNVSKKAKKNKSGSQTNQFIHTCVTNSLKKYFKHITRYQAHEVSNGGWGLLFEHPEIAKEIDEVDFTTKINANIFPDDNVEINDFCNFMLKGCTKTEALRNVGWTRKKFDENRDYIEKYLLERINKREE